MPTAWIISIGTELTLGQSLDTNGQWLARQLAAQGIRTTRHLTLADELPEIVSALQAAFEACDVLIVTGGLGPTADDLTRAALAAALDDELVRDERSLAEIAAFFEQRGRTMTDRNRSQAERPSRAGVIPNPVGTAPGLTAVAGDCHGYVLPGVPFEMKTMFSASVAPALAARFRGRVVLSRRLQSYGMGESDVAARIGDLMRRGANPEVGTTASLGIIGVRINAEADDAAAATHLLDAAEAEIRRRLGDVVFGTGEQTLGDSVGELLSERQQTVAVAESCTGGLLGAALTDRPGSSSYFLGGVVAYSNAVKAAQVGVPEPLLAEHGAVSGPVAEALATQVRARLGSDFGLSVTGIAGPGGGTADKPVGLVYFGLAGPGGVEVVEQRFGASSPRDVIRARSVHHALHLLRRALLTAGAA